MIETAFVFWENFPKVERIFGKLEDNNSCIRISTKIIVYNDDFRKRH